MRLLTASAVAFVLASGYAAPALADSQSADTAASSVPRIALNVTSSALAPSQDTVTQSSELAAEAESVPAASGQSQSVPVAAPAAPVAAAPVTPHINPALTNPARSTASVAVRSLPSAGSDVAMWEQQQKSNAGRQTTVVRHASVVHYVVVKHAHHVPTHAQATSHVQHAVAHVPAHEQTVFESTHGAGLGGFAAGIFARTRQIASRLTSSAMHFLGVPYVFGGTSARGFDCSGYVQHVFAMFGIHLPRTADAQFLVGRRVASTNMTRGDLVFFQTYAPGASHVGIYLGNGRFVHSANGGVQVSSLRESYWSAHYLGARHVIGAAKALNGRSIN